MSGISYKPFTPNNLESLRRIIQPYDLKPVTIDNLVEQNYPQYIKEERVTEPIRTFSDAFPLYIKSKTKVVKNYVETPTAEFQKAYKAAGLPDDSLKDYMAKMAKIESDYVLNPVSNNPAIGWFQFMPKTLTDYNVKSNFANDPIAQIQVMYKYTLDNLKTLKRLGVLQKGLDAGYSVQALLAGAHLGGVGGVQKFLNGEGNPKDSNGTSVKQRMDNFNHS